MITGNEIKRLVANGAIEIDPFIEENVGPNSIDLRLDKKLLVYENQNILDMKKENKTKEIIIPEGGFILQPGILYLGSTIELTKSDTLIPCIEGRSSLGRLGIFCHISAGFGDIGFNAQWTLEIMCVHPIRIYAGERICQAFFTYPIGRIEDKYEGRYQGQKGATASRFYENIGKEVIMEDKL